MWGRNYLAQHHGGWGDIDICSPRLIDFFGHSSPLRSSSSTIPQVRLQGGLHCLTERFYPLLRTRILPPIARRSRTNNAPSFWWILGGHTALLEIFDLLPMARSSLDSGRSTTTITVVRGCSCWPHLRCWLTSGASLSRLPSLGSPRGIPLE